MLYLRVVYIMVTVFSTSPSKCATLTPRKKNGPKVKRTFLLFELGSKTRFADQNGHSGLQKHSPQAPIGVGPFLSALVQLTCRTTSTSLIDVAYLAGTTSLVDAGLPRSHPNLLHLQRLFDSYSPTLPWRMPALQHPSRLQQLSTTDCLFWQSWTRLATL